MKRLTAILLALLLLLTACGKETLPTQPQESYDDLDLEDFVDEVEDETVFDMEALVAVDNEECLIKFTGINMDSVWGYSLEIYMENKSKEKDYMFSVERACINGVECDPFFACDVPAEQSITDEITFFADDLKNNGVGDFTDIELQLRVYDSEDWEAAPVAEETVHVYPYGEDRAVTFVRESQPTDRVILDNEYATVIVTACRNDDLWGYCVDLYLVNKGQQNMMFTVDDALVNGVRSDPFFSCSVSSGKCAFSTVYWMEDSLKQMNITQVESIVCSLRVYDYDDWLAEDLVNQTVTLTP